MTEKETGVIKTLLAVDGSDSAVRATRKLVETLSWYKDAPQVELVRLRPARSCRAESLRT